ncbi:MAG: class I SAM-dependent methyltransferase [Bacteroidales bacterium]
MEKIKKALGLIDPASVLDLCTGTGQFIHIMKESFHSNTDITGIDIDENALSEAEKQFPGAKFLPMPADKITFADDSFEAVSISRGLHHLDNVERVIAGVRRVLKKRGYFIVNEMYADQQNEKQQTSVLFHHLRVDIDRYLGIVHNYTFKRQKIIEWFNIDYWELLEIFDYVPTEKKNVPDMISKYRETIDRINDKKQREHFNSRLEELIERIETTGIGNPSTLLVIARKN